MSEKMELVGVLAFATGTVKCTTDTEYQCDSLANRMHSISLPPKVKFFKELMDDGRGCRFLPIRKI